MKKIILLSVFLTILIAIPLKTQSAPVITIVSATVTKNNVYINFNTDVTTTASISYGTSSNNLDQIIESGSDNNTLHYVTIEDLAYETKYYYRIKVTTLDGATSYSGIESFTTETNVFRLESVILSGVGPRTAVATTTTNFYTGGGVIHYGTSPNNLNKQGGSACGFRCGNISYTWTHYLESLEPNTKYYYQIGLSSYDGSEEFKYIDTDVYSFTTTEIPTITSITPTSGPVGTLVTVNGSGFGDGSDKYPNTQFNIGFGCELNKDKPSCLGDIVSWSNTKIVAKVKNGTKSGVVYLQKKASIDLFTISGPQFTIESGSIQTNAADQSGGGLITEKYGCSYSTSEQNDNTIKVDTLFTESGTTDKYLNDVFNAYQIIWNRAPRCDELQFHYEHNTSLDTLNNWLNEQQIQEKYGCKYSSTVSDADTIRINGLFTMDSEPDKYFNSVYSAYVEKWGREPRCDELQFHYDHNTSLERLNTWLSENASADEEWVKVEFEIKDDGTTLTTVNTNPKFKENELITFKGTTEPNSLVVLTISSENPSTYTIISDNNGNWLYTLPGPLEIGSHILTVSVFDKDNKKIRESGSIPFEVTSISSTTSSTTNKWWGWIIVAIITVIAVLVIINSKKKIK